MSTLPHVASPEARQIVADAQGTLVAERLAEGKTRRRARGLYCDNIGYGRKKAIGPDGHPYPLWDEQQLAYIAEIAERLANDESVVKVAEDFWRHRARDHRGLPWGKVVPKNGSTPKGSPYEHFRRAVRWFHRAKHAEELPPPWNEVAWTIPEPRGFRVKKRPKSWTPGGKERQAEAKAKRHAEKLHRWEEEKAARVQSRVHKPALARLETARCVTN